MAYELVKIESNGEIAGCFDLHIMEVETGTVMVADCVKIWEDDQESLEEMFEAVQRGEW